MPKKKEDNKGPTPKLGLPNANRQMFTYSENKLLDQITTEIMQSWAHDLNTIRMLHHKTSKAANNAERAAEIIEENLPSLYKFINGEEFRFLISEIKRAIEALNLRQAEMNKSIFELEKKLEFNYIKELQQSIKKISDDMKEIKLKEKKKLWEKIFKPKT